MDLNKAPQPHSVPTPAYRNMAPDCQESMVVVHYTMYKNFISVEYFLCAFNRAGLRVNENRGHQL